MLTNSSSLQNPISASDFQGELTSIHTKSLLKAYQQSVTASLFPKTEVGKNTNYKRCFPTSGKYRAQPIRMPEVSVQRFYTEISYTGDVSEITDWGMIYPLIEQGAQEMALKRNRMAIYVFSQAEEPYGNAVFNLSERNLTELDNIAHQSFDNSHGRIYLVMNGAVYPKDLENTSEPETITVFGQRYRSRRGMMCLRDDNIPTDDDNAKSTGLMFAQEAVQAVYATIRPPISFKYDRDTGLTTITMQDWYGAILVHKESAFRVTASVQ